MNPMTNYTPGRLIIKTILFIICLAAFLSLFGCTTPEERMAGNKEMEIIAQEFKLFAEECYYGDGHLMIDSPFYERRIQNAPITVWEMKDAICKYDDLVYPVRLYYD